MRTVEDALRTLGRIETSMATVELALTRLRFTADRPAPGDEEVLAALLQTVESLNECATLLAGLHTTALLDVETIRQSSRARRPPAGLHEQAANPQSPTCLSLVSASIPGWSRSKA